MTQLDFTILEDLNTSRMLFIDISDYSVTPINPMLHIQFPDLDKVYSTPVQYGDITILNTKRVGWSPELIDFPDGIYKLEFEVNNKSCSNKKIIFRTTKAWQMLDSILSTSEYNTDLLEKFNKINLYLRGAEATVCSDSRQAQQLYKQALDILNCFPNNDVRMFTKQCSSCTK